MRLRFPAAAVLAMLALPAAAADPAPDVEAPPEMEAESAFDPSQVDIVALLECRADAPAYSGFAFWLEGDPQAPSRLGWRRLPTGHDLPAQFALANPVTVFGHAARQVVIGPDGPLAVLGDVAPSALARQLRLTPGSAAPGRFLAERLVAKTDEDDRDQGMRLHMRVTLQVATALFLPGKTLAGCSYEMETEELEDSGG
jgi:hypothetical protein